jgi:hypothetical protein
VLNTTHLAKSDSGPGDEEVYSAINEFFTTHFLRWIEVLSLIENLATGVYALNHIDQWYIKVSCVYRSH